MGLSSCTRFCLIIEFKGPWRRGGRRKNGLGLCKKLISSGVIPFKQPRDNGWRIGESLPELWEECYGKLEDRGQQREEMGNSQKRQQLKALFTACVKEQTQAHNPRTLWKEDLTLTVYHADWGEKDNRGVVLTPLHENAQRTEWILKPVHTERRKTNSTWSFPQSTGALGGTVMVELWCKQRSTEEHHLVTQGAQEFSRVSLFFLSAYTHMGSTRQF